MIRARLGVYSLLLTAICLSACKSGGSGDPAPAPAPEVVPDTAAAATLAADWQWQGTLGDRAIRGSWRFNLVNGRWTGVIERDDMPPAPLRTMTTSGVTFTFTVEWNGEEHTISGRLESPRSLHATISKTAAQGRLTAQRR